MDEETTYTISGFNLRFIQFVEDMESAGAITEEMGVEILRQGITFDTYKGGRVHRHFMKKMPASMYKQLKRSISPGDNRISVTINDRDISITSYKKAQTGALSDIE